MQHKQQRANATHYTRSVDFFELFDISTFDEEVTTDVCWMGFVRDEDGMLQLAAEYIYDEDGDAGWAWDCC